MIKEKIKTIEEIEKIVKKLKEEKKIIVTTNGSYDILHKGHVKLLEDAKKLGDVLIVLLNSDSSVRENKSKEGKGTTRPYVPENDRAFVIAGLESVDYVVIFNEEKPLKYLEKIKPNIQVKGGSGILERYKEEKEFIEKFGGKYIVFDLEKGYSTTNIEQTILERNRN